MCVYTYHINGTGNYGVAVTLDGLYLVVSNSDAHNLSVYSKVTGSRISTFGSMGSRAGQFLYPGRICATPRGTILVCESGNKRLQEITMTGKHVRFIGVGHLDSLFDDSVFGLCLQGDIVAVGKMHGSTNGRIVLFSYSSGAFIRKFGSYGPGEGQVRNITGLSFTSDGRHILVAEFASRLTLFTVDGAFVKTIGVGVIAVGCKDVLCSGPSVFTVDSWNHCIRVFSSETGALIQTWGTRGHADGQFSFPTTLTAHNSNLFVRDRQPRVQVFE